MVPWHWGMGLQYPCRGLCVVQPAPHVAALRSLRPAGRARPGTRDTPTPAHKTHLPRVTRKHFRCAPSLPLGRGQWRPRVEQQRWGRRVGAELLLWLVRAAGLESLGLGLRRLGRKRRERDGTRRLGAREAPAPGGRLVPQARPAPGGGAAGTHPREALGAPRAARPRLGIAALVSVAGGRARAVSLGSCGHLACG